MIIVEILIGTIVGGTGGFTAGCLLFYGAYGEWPCFRRRVPR